MESPDAWNIGAVFCSCVKIVLKFDFANHYKPLAIRFIGNI